MNALLLGLALTAAQDFQVPRNDGWVTDLAGLLSPAEEQALESRMDSYRVGTEHDIALLTLPSLGGRSIEEVALLTAREWKLGGEDLSDGALLVVAQEERELRIEVGRGLEGTLTDAVSGRIIRNVIVPEFKAGRQFAGIERGIEAIHAAIGGDYGPIERSPGGRAAGASGIGCLVSVLLLIVFLRLMGGRRGPGGMGGLGGMLPWILLSTMSHGRSRGFGGGLGGGGGFRGFGGGGGFSGGGASGGW